MRGKDCSYGIFTTTKTEEDPAVKDEYKEARDKSKESVKKKTAERSISKTVASNIGSRWMLN